MSDMDELISVSDTLELNLAELNSTISILDNYPEFKRSVDKLNCVC